MANAIFQADEVREEDVQDDDEEEDGLGGDEVEIPLDEL